MFLIFSSRDWYSISFSFLLPSLSFFILDRSSRFIRSPICPYIYLFDSPSRSALIYITLFRSRCSSRELFFRYSSLSMVIFLRERRYFLGTASV